MPTDGADFGRTRPCYGKAYTMARDGACELDIAECVMRGIELDIKRNGGLPAFPVGVDIIVLACQCGDRGERLLAEVDRIRRDFVDSPLTRHLADGVERIGLSAIAEGRIISRETAAKSLLVQIGESRCCDGMTGYIARNRTQDLPASHCIVGAIKSELAHTPSLQDLSTRMLNCSAKGLPARAIKAAPLTYSAESLDDHEL